MTEKTSPQTAAESSQAQPRVDLFQRTGRVFVTPAEFPELCGIGVVQKFASSTGEWTHRVEIAHGALQCTCPGWRKHAKCWHVRWVLENSMREWTIGAYIVRLPTVREVEAFASARDAEEWLLDAIATVGLEERPGPSPLDCPDRHPPCLHVPNWGRNGEVFL